MRATNPTVSVGPCAAAVGLLAVLNDLLTALVG